MLTGEKKKAYQRNYMRIRRAKEKLYKTYTLQLKLNSGVVRPKTSILVRPLDTDGNVIYDND